MEVHYYDSSFFRTGKAAHHIFGSLDFITKDIMTIAQDNNAVIEYLKKKT